MGWERKRGKLHELNRLLRGATDTTFLADGGGAPVVPAGVRYVITLDADTRLPRGAAKRLVGKMAHALNGPRFDKRCGRVVDGYAVLQPRVTPSLPTGREGSVFQRVFSGPGGIDPYAFAVSDVYQDLFGEGNRGVVRVRMRGINTGGLPWFGIPANGAKVDVEWITEFRLEDGKVVETWAQMELPTMMQQLGAMPGPAM